MDVPRNDDQSQNIAIELGKEGRSTTEEDYIEVKFDGNNDRMCPRSMSRLRKWMLVAIVCAGTCCV